MILLLQGCGNPSDGRESFGDKREWSILQGLEFESRENSVSKFEIIGVVGYSVLSIPRKDSVGSIFILLNPESAPFYKQMPNVPYVLSKAHFAEIKNSGKATSTVIEALKSHVN